MFSLALFYAAYFIAKHETYPFYLAMEFNKSYVHLEDFSSISQLKKNSPEHEAKVAQEIIKIQNLLNDNLVPSTEKVL